MSLTPNPPKFYPRAHFTGILKWVCPFCGHVNSDQIRPGTLALKCGGCERHIFYGLALHVPMNATTKLPRDVVVPEWADSEYPFDCIPARLQESMVAAFFDPNKKVRQRGRVNVLILSDGIYIVK